MIQSMQTVWPIRHVRPKGILHESDLMLGGRLDPSDTTRRKIRRIQQRLSRPTAFLPGSPEKVLLMIRRARFGVPIFIQGDWQGPRVTLAGVEQEEREPKGLGPNRDRDSESWYAGTAVTQYKREKHQRDYQRRKKKRRRNRERDTEEFEDACDDGSE